MKIHGLELPLELEADLNAGGRKLSDDELARLRALLDRVESPLPILFDYEEIINANEVWESAASNHYLGSLSNSVVPGDIDPQRTLIIGEAESESPIALDYRASPARVVYLGDIDYVPYWIELSSDYKSFVSMFEKETI